MCIRKLCNDVATKTNRWKEIALNLHISHTDIERIGIESESVQESFCKVFEKWWKEDKLPFVWSTMVDVLRSPVVGENALAGELDLKYCQ